MTQSHFKKSIALFVGIAALTVPAGAAAYPMIPDDPGPAVQAQGLQWMKTHQQKVKKTRHTTTRRNGTCPSKVHRVRCNKP
jgi:hypothetical protein